jgi:PAS domain S-box-containing protein
MSVGAQSLFQAIVASSDAPLLILDAELKIVAASASFCRVFQAEPGDVEGRSIFQLEGREWELPKLRSLLNAVVSGGAEINPYELDMERRSGEVRRLVITAQRLTYDDDAPRFLVTLSDITDARLAKKVNDDLVKEKAVLKKEVQHRVANSLQIIASILMQSARNVRSDETRSHLHDAHNRVMSFANVQRHLGSSEGDDVELRAYFDLLCRSLGASMIADHDKQRIEVSVDDSRVFADVSISLGLIVTELVINALKHAFPQEQSGKIIVDYHAHGRDWRLSVSDDGVGMPPDSPRAIPGLGASIVQALARQLEAEIRVASAGPGTNVSIVHVDNPARGYPNTPARPAL